MSYQYIEKIENLNNVVFIAAWSGWSDAAESATKSLKEIINQTKAKKFASIDPEDYYLYSETLSKYQFEQLPIYDPSVEVYLHRAKLELQEFFYFFL